MEGSKEALEEVAREFVALYGRDASKMLRDRAAVADEYGDKFQAQAWREIAAIAAARPKLVMRNYRFICKDGQIVDTSMVRKRFFESALQSGAGPVRATRIWNDMLFGDAY